MDDDAQASFRLIEKLNQMLLNRGITLAVTVVPSKMETHREQLPDHFKISRYMTEFNDRLTTTLRNKGVQVIDLKKSLREAALADIDNPVFYRLDTHWTHSGAMAAAKAIQKGIESNQILKKAFDATPVTAYKLVWKSQKTRHARARDITNFLPPDTPRYPPEETLKFSVQQANGPNSRLLGELDGGEFALVGSSFSGDWTGFPDALRFVLQRKVFNMSVRVADTGPWAVMRAYLQDDAFQRATPKFILWEIPDRSIGLGPNYKFRVARYKTEPSEWLLQVAALIEPDCELANLAVKLGVSNASLPAGPPSVGGGSSAEFMDVDFEVPVNASVYLSAKLKAQGASQIMMETWDHTRLVRRFEIDTQGDELDHAFKVPLLVGPRGLTRLRLFKGAATDFDLKDIRICSYQNNWLK